MSRSCYACRLAEGEARLIGGVIAQTEHWRVEHCMGTLGTGTLIVKPRRHVVDVHALDAAEAREMGPVLTEAARVVTVLTHAERTYVCLWSHQDWKKGHIHFVVQPVNNSQRKRFSGTGPTLQSEMFRAAVPLVETEVEAFCDRARATWRR